MDLNEIKTRMKRLDYEVIKILNQRMELVLRTTRLQENGLTRAEEQEFLDSIAGFSDGLVGADLGRKLLAEIISESRRIQARVGSLVGFSGEHGANGEIAVNAYDANLVPIPCMKFIDVFEGVEKGWFDFGMVPVENSLEGGVTEVNDLLVLFPLHIIGEVKIPIHHTYMTLPETEPGAIRAVYSHPQALAQCRGFIARHRLEDLPFYNTAGAARMLSETRPKASAVIANKLCAEIYNLKIIKENIEDQAENYTRFVLLGRSPSTAAGTKCSVVFCTHHACGALNRVLTIFANAGINLTRIESRPSRSEPGNFVFLVDFNGSMADEHIARTLDAVKQATTMYKLLGCYEEKEKKING